MRRAVALAPEKGAGCLVWASALDRVEAAVVLEPEQLLLAARSGPPMRDFEPLPVGPGGEKRGAAQRRRSR